MRSNGFPQSAVQPLQRQRQMRAALVRRDGVDLVDDDGARGLEHRAARLGAEQDVERLRRRDDDVRRAATRSIPLARRRVAGAHPAADLDVGQPLLAQRLADAGQRRLEVALDVVRQRLERRDVDDLGLVLEPALEPLPHERVDRGEERGQRLAGAGRRGDQHVPPGLDRRPSLGLRRRGGSEAAGKPRGDRGMKQGGGARLERGLGLEHAAEMTARRLKSKRVANRDLMAPIAAAGTVVPGRRYAGNEKIRQQERHMGLGRHPAAGGGGDHRPVGGRVGGACGGRCPTRRGNAGPGIRCRRGAACGRYFFSRRFVKLALPSPVPMVSTPQWRRSWT